MIKSIRIPAVVVLGLAIAFSLLILIASVLVAFVAGHSAFYFPLHPDAPYQRTLLQAANLAPYVAALIIASSLTAFLFGYQTVASFITVIGWGLFLLASFVWLALVERGPQEFMRDAGDYRFLIPWQYGPNGSEKHQSGFSVHFCMHSLEGSYGIGCGNNLDNTQLMVRTADGNRLPPPETFQFDRHASRFSSIPDRSDHKGFQVPNTIIRYYALYNSEGKLARLVNCSGGVVCRHTVAGDGLLLQYQRPEAEFEKWKENDERLSKLVKSWVDAR